MAVEPDRQRHGIGCAMLEDVKRIVRARPGDAIRLDAYDLPGGAGEFYAKCGYEKWARHLPRRAADLLRTAAVVDQCQDCPHAVSTNLLRLRVWFPKRKCVLLGIETDGEVSVAWHSGFGHADFAAELLQFRDESTHGRTPT